MNDLKLIEINSGFFINNLNILKKKLFDAYSNIFFILKSHAYGHGLKNILTLLKQNEQGRGIGVAFVKEALLVRDCGWKGEIFVLVEVPNEKEIIEECIKKKIILVIKNKEEMKIICLIKKKIEIVIECETGMNRFGIKENELEEIILLLKENKQVKIHSLQTHCAESNLLENKRIKKQEVIFRENFVYIMKKIDIEIKSHICASGTLKEGGGEIARCGTYIYGIYKSLENKEKLEKKGIKLSQIFSLKGKIIDIKNVDEGEYIGYGNDYRADKKMTIATIPIGFGDGFPYQLSNECFGWTKDSLVKQFGKIGMNTMSFDITEFKKKLAINDYLYLYSNEKEELRFNMIGKKLNTNVLTLPTAMSQDIKRVTI